MNGEGLDGLEKLKPTNDETNKDNSPNIINNDSILANNIIETWCTSFEKVSRGM